MTLVPLRDGIRKDSSSCIQGGCQAAAAHLRHGGRRAAQRREERLAADGRHERGRSIPVGPPDHVPNASRPHRLGYAAQVEAAVAVAFVSVRALSSRRHWQSFSIIDAPCFADTRASK